MYKVPVFYFIFLISVQAFDPKVVLKDWKADQITSFRKADDYDALEMLSEFDIAQSEKSELVTWRKEPETILLKLIATKFNFKKLSKEDNEVIFKMDNKKIENFLSKTQYKSVLKWKDELTKLKTKKIRTGQTKASPEEPQDNISPNLKVVFGLVTLLLLICNANAAAE